ncbi:hypothetical protein T4C_10706 [Trichinella pseudospiralis]|uniref:Uncharacterized protein n=1 Tax=Trichinella pseudospiralis TaxID=6337 RepID=A0A0V1ITX3_TRIPS|nr:hypothetical protein T4C_10706 [Trichinella pseudospiralis]
MESSVSVPECMDTVAAYVNHGLFHLVGSNAGSLTYCYSFVGSGVVSFEADFLLFCQQRCGFLPETFAPVLSDQLSYP